MKYPQSVPMPRDVEDWLEGELEARGIDAVVYTRYILSLLRQDPIDPCDSLPYLQSIKGDWSGNKCKRSGLERWPSWDDDALRRLAVVRCLMSASDQKCDIETLVDELCTKLKDIQSGAVDANSTFPKSCEIPTFTADYNAAFPPLHGGSNSNGKGPTNSTWTRGILRASLDRTDASLPYDDIINAEDCFSLMYCGPQKIFGPLDSLISEKAQGRLYERATDRGLNRILDKFDSSFDDAWKPNYLASNTNHPSDQYYFFNCHNLFSPTLFGFGEATAASATWSLGGSATTLRNHWQSGSCFKEVAPGGIIEGPRVEPREPNIQAAEEEDLLTSARTHFRPIRSEDSGNITLYADGTTFAISTELEELPFQRSESGTLFLETGKYMEYKKEDTKEDGGQEFVPKFRVRQSNEKFCQTEDVIENVADGDQSVPTDSPDTSISDPDEFFFPGDEALALDINTEELSSDIKIIQNELTIVSVDNITESKRYLQSCNLEPPKFSGLEDNWDADDAALVDGLVNEDVSWKTPPDSNFKLSAEDGMDSLNGGFENDSEKLASAWPPLTESIWNPINPAQACDGCKLQSIGREDSKNLMSKSEWREIWGPTFCDDCKEESSEINNFDWETAIKDGSDGPVEGIWNKCSAFNNFEPKTDDQNALDTNQIVDWSSFGPVSSDKRLDEADKSDCRFTTFGAVLSAYLEESRVRAFELLDVWHEGSGGIMKKSESRELWSPVNTSNEGLVHLTKAEWREIWSSGVGVKGNENFRNNRAPTYTQLREELSEDGDQLLSDLSCLHLQQLGSGNVTDASDILEDDSFPTAPPSPNWEKNFHGCKTWSGLDLNHAVLDTQKDDRIYNNETAQKERKRRNSSSQKVCELYMEGECRRPHCRFLHCDAAIPCPFYDDASCTRGDACPLSHIPRAGREPQRAFTL